MNDWTPGEGWREVDVNGEEAQYVVYGLAEYDQDTGAIKRAWVREEPVPPLPTVPYTVIRVQQKNEAAPAVLTLADDGYWYLLEPHTVRHSARELSRIVDSFEVLAEPRAVTAKALLAEARAYVFQALAEDISFEHIAKRYGVES